MTAIIICSPQNGWARVTRTTLSQPSADCGVAALFKYVGRICAIFGHVSSARVQGYGGCQETTGHRTPISFQSAALFSVGRSVIVTASSHGDVTAGSLLRLSRGSRPFYSFGPSKVARHLHPVGSHRALTVCQDTAREFANRLHFLTPSAGSTGSVSTCDGHISTEGKSTCPTKEFPKSETIFPGLT
jgi:hypothetical protein